MKKKIMFSAGYDKRGEKNLGIHGLEIRFILKNYKGAVQFLIFTNWFPSGPGLNWFEIESCRDDSETKPMFVTILINHFLPAIFRRPIPADLGYHSPKPMYENHKPMGPCEFLDGKECYYDGSTLNAMKIFKALLTDGEEGVWRELKDYHEYVFGGSLLKRIGKKMESILIGYLRFTGVDKAIENMRNIRKELKRE